MKPIMPQVVCISGKRGHGKSTLAQYLINVHGYQELTFAGPLKKGCQAIFGLSDQQVHDPVAKEIVDPFWKVTPREILQICGTELFRNRLSELLPSCSSIWIRTLIRQLSSLPRDAKVVITDCRFPDEWKAMQSIGALMVRVVRPGYVADEKFASHTSETALDDYNLYTPDVLLYNDTNIEDLVKQCENVVLQRIKPALLL